MSTDIGDVRKILENIKNYISSGQGIPDLSDLNSKQRIFSLFDSNNDELLNFSELHNLLSVYGVEGTMSQEMDLFSVILGANYIDAGGAGIDFGQAISLFDAISEALLDPPQ